MRHVSSFLGLSLNIRDNGQKTALFWHMYIYCPCFISLKIKLLKLVNKSHNIIGDSVAVVLSSERNHNKMWSTDLAAIQVKPA